MKIRYIGDKADNTSFGIYFSQGQWVEVNDIMACKKLSGNPCFEVMPGEEIEDAEFEEVAPKRRGRKPKVEVINGDSGGSQEEGSN